MRYRFTTAPILLAVAVAAFADDASKPILPAVGQTAMNFTLKTLDQNPVSLYELTKDHKVVLVALRGYPGYQCPICTKQVGELVQHSKALADANAHVLLVYPGPSEELQAHAKEFIENTTLPANFTFVIDPDYAFTSLYQLRWDAEGETAYPSTFVVDRANKITYAKISKSHGDRAPIDDVIHAAKQAE